jgi:MoaA/NifB/PqqE/SkfB family radical SAM enzyme
MAYAIGVGLTNECKLRCPHYYRPDAVIDRLTLQDIQRVCEAIPVRSMNLGVGETVCIPTAMPFSTT